MSKLPKKYLFALIILALVPISLIAYQFYYREEVPKEISFDRQKNSISFDATVLGVTDQELQVLVTKEGSSKIEKISTVGAKFRLLMFDPKLSQQYWESLAPLVNINNLCKDNGIEFVVVLIPEDIQVDSKIAEAALKTYKSVLLKDPNESYGYDLAKKGKFIDFTIPNKTLRADLKRHSIQVIDLYDSFANYYNETDSKDLYIPYDGHWNVYGNRLAAESLVEPLLNNADIVSFMGNMSKAPSSD